MDLSGVFLRIGPNPARPEKLSKGYHFFGGDGMVHRVELRGGVANYKCRWVRTRSFVDEVDTIGNELSGKANTAMVYHAGKLLCLEEGSKPWQLALPSLETVGRFTFNESLRHNFTAHPKVCPDTGEMMFFGYGFHDVEGSDAWIHYSVVDKEGSLVRTLPVNFREPVMTHDMAITRNYTILADFPLWDLTSPTKEEDRSRFGIFPRHSQSDAEIIWFDAPGQYGYHVANAWERLDSNVVELVMVSSMNFHFRRSNSGLRLHLWAFDLGTRVTIEDCVLSDIPCDFPIVDARCVGKRTRFIWASRLNSKIAEPLAIDGLLRYDLEKRETLQLTFPGGRRGGETQFVPRRYENGVRGTEGDGYLLVFTFMPDSGASELLVFDASTMSEVPLAIVSIPTRVPYGFHALWVDTERYEDRECNRSRL